MKKQLTYVLVIVLGLVFVGADVAPTNSSSVVNATAVNGSITETPTAATSAENATTATTPRPEACAMSIQDAENCTACVLNNCTYIQESYGGKCTDTPGEDQFTMWISHSVAECLRNDTTTTTVAPANTTSTTPTTTPAPTTTTQTTTTPQTTPATNGTTTTTAPTTPTTPATNTTAPTPTAATTKSPAPIPEPSKGGFGWGSFFSGIVFTMGLSAVGYIVWRFYKRRSEGNYHTL